MDIATCHVYLCRTFIPLPSWPQDLVFLFLCHLITWSVPVLPHVILSTWSVLASFCMPSQLQFKSSFAIATKGHVPVPCCVCSIMISSIFLIICSCAFLHLFSQQRFCFIRPSVYLPVSVFTGLFQVVRIRMGPELFAGSGTIRKEQINKILFLILGLWILDCAFSTKSIFFVLP